MNTMNKGKWTFLHIPKTAGGSIRTALPDEAINYQGHKRLSDMVKIYPDLDLSMLFTVTRNPYDRAVSQYGHAMQNYPDRLPVDKQEFKSFWFDKGSLANLGDQLMFKEQTFYLVLPGGELAVSTFIRYENLAEDLWDLFHVSLPEKHYNSTQRDWDYRKYYDDDLQEYIYKRFETDFKNFGYSKDFPNEIPDRKPFVTRAA